MTGTAALVEAARSESRTKEKQWTIDEARVVLGRWRASGQSIREFARGHRLTRQRLYYWQKRLGERESTRRPDMTSKTLGALGFVPLVATTPDNACTATVTRHKSVVIETRAGTRIEVLDTDHIPTQWLCMLVRGLEGHVS